MKKRRSFEAQLTRFSLISSVPLLALLLWVMIYADISIWLILLTAFIGSILILYSTSRIYQKTAFQFRSLSNLLEAMIQGEYSLRARSNQGDGALGDLVVAINGLALRLSEQRREADESLLLVQTIIEHIDVAIIALNEDNKIGFLNPEAKKLLGLDQVGSDAKLLKQLAFVQGLSSGRHQVVDLSLGHRQGRFNVHVEEFRQSSLQHKLLFITDVTSLLRSEERKAWQSLVRVISHEINNSLSPIASISQTLNRLISREGQQADNTKDLVEGLTIITERANGLSQFVGSYKQLAGLPEPKKQDVSILALIEKVCLLFKEQSIIIETDLDVELLIDPVQIEQVLINLFKNAVEAMAHISPAGVITVEWQVTGPYLSLTICDQGGGISNPDNLFVPFYSTKKNGSGIGLVLCRQIIEAHNGRLLITNLPNSTGCSATIELPVEQ